MFLVVKIERIVDGQLTTTERIVNGADIRFVDPNPKTGGCTIHWRHGSAAHDTPTEVLNRFKDVRRLLCTMPVAYQDPDHATTTLPGPSEQD